MTSEQSKGRLRGGLLRIRDVLTDWSRRDRVRDMGWSVAGAVVGSGIGILFAALYLRYHH